MSRYIDADDFFRTFSELNVEPYNNFPTVDSASLSQYKSDLQCKYINHRDDDGHHIADCSLCGKTMQWFDEDDEDGGVPKFCWYCGATIGDIE